MSGCYENHCKNWFCDSHQKWDPELAGLFALWIDIEKRAYSWMQHKCSRHSACHIRCTNIGIYVRAWVGLPLLADKEKPHDSRLFSDYQSIIHEYDTRSFVHSSVVSCAYIILTGKTGSTEMFWYSHNETFQYLGPEVYLFQIQECIHLAGVALEQICKDPWGYRKIKSKGVIQIWARPHFTDLCSLLHTCGSSESRKKIGFFRDVTWD